MARTPPPATSPERWDAVDRYFGDLLGTSDPVLREALQSSAAAGLPPIQVSPLQGKLLYLLATAVAARRILEVGTLGGYSTIWLARALPPDGRLVTLELDPRHAEVARANLARAGLGDRVDVRVGAASKGLEALATEGVAPFDLVFLDADKIGYPTYLAGALRLAREGTLVVVDNVVRHGAVVDPTAADPDVQGVRRMAEMMGGDPRLSATVVQTVGTKGYDGFALAVVRRAPTGAGVRPGD